MCRRASLLRGNGAEWRADPRIAKALVKRPGAEATASRWAGCWLGRALDSPICQCANWGASSRAHSQVIPCAFVLPHMDGGAPPPTVRAATRISNSREPQAASRTTPRPPRALAPPLCEKALHCPGQTPRDTALETDRCPSGAAPCSKAPHWTLAPEHRPQLPRVARPSHLAPIRLSSTARRQRTARTGSSGSRS